MLTRCLSPNRKDFHNYGGRAEPITVCERWKAFPNFLDDLGVRPRNKSLDRVDNDLRYYNDNCKYSTPKQQGANRRPTVKKGEAEVVAKPPCVVKKRRN
jgi:hypothetical protein